MKQAAAALSAKIPAAIVKAASLPFGLDLGADGVAWGLIHLVTLIHCTYYVDYV